MEHRNIGHGYCDAPIELDHIDVNSTVPLQMQCALQAINNSKCDPEHMSIGTIDEEGGTLGRCLCGSSAGCGNRSTTEDFDQCQISSLSGGAYCIDILSDLS